MQPDFSELKYPANKRLTQRHPLLLSIFKGKQLR